MTGILSGATYEAVSELIELQDGTNATIVDAATPLGNGVDKVAVSFIVPLATADLSFLKGKRSLTIYDIDAANIKPFDARITVPYNVTGGNQVFSVEVYVPKGLSFTTVSIVKDDNFEKKLVAGAAYAAELESLGATDVKLAMNSSEFLKYNQLVHQGVAMPTDTVNRYQGFEISVIPALQNGILVTTREASHVVSGASASDVQGEDLQIYDLSIIGEKKYRARLSVMVGAKAQFEYTTLFI
jgi:hypothetical protein